MNLMPTPKVVEETGGRFPVSGLRLKNGGDCPIAAGVFQDYVSGMAWGDGRPLGVSLRLVRRGGKAEALPSEAEKTLAKDDDAYVLSVGRGGVNAWSRSERGLIYSVHTLFQLIEGQQGRSSLPCVRIDDWPDFTMRGLLDDISRLQVSTVENFKRIIRELSRLKYNYYFLYMEDMFRFEKHPSIGADYGALTKDEARAIVEEGKRYGVEVVPHLQSLGHLARVLALPKYRRYGEHTSKRSSCLAVGDPRIYPLLADWYEELFEVFDSEYIHIGCDEVHEMGTGRSKQLVQRRGKAAVYVEHLLRIADIIRPYDRQILFWGDMLNPRYGHAFEVTTEHLQKLREAGLILVNWDYYQHEPYEYFPYVNLLNREGLRQVISPGIWGWRQIFPSYEETEHTLTPFFEIGLAENVREGLVTSWCDRGDNLREDHYHNYAYAAECLWNLDARDRNPVSFSERFCSQFYGAAPDALVEAHVLLGHLNETLYRCARHDSRFPKRGDMYRMNNWLLFWEKPTPGAGSREDAVRSREVASQAKALASRVRAAIKDVSRNRANVESVVFGLQRLAFAADSVEFGASPTAVKARTLARRLKGLKADFSELWLRTNKPERLDIIEKRFDDLIAWWEKPDAL